MAYNKETGMWEGFIYKIWNDVNNKVYIGQTITTISTRFSGHKNCVKNDKYQNYIYNAMRKIGIEHFYVCQEYKILSDNKRDLRIQLDNKEQILIKKYKDNKIPLYNMTKGGDHIADGYFNKPIIQYDLSGNVIKKYNSIMDAAYINNISYSTISGACNNRHYTSMGCIWRFENDQLTEDDILEIKKHSNSFRIKKSVCQYTLDGKFVNKYNSLSDASKKTDINLSDICMCCNDKIRYAGNFIWRYENNPISTYKFFNDLDRNNKLREFNKTKRKRIEQRDMYDGTLINRYDSMVEGALSINKQNPSLISHCCLNKVRSAYGYHWCYEGCFNRDNLKNVKHKK